MSFRNALTLSVAAGILATLSVIPASAGTFAQFVQQTGGNAFSLSGATSPGQVLGTTATPVFFQFKTAPQNPTFLGPAGAENMDIMALLTLNAVSTAGAAPSGSSASEAFGNITATFTSQVNQTVGGLFIPIGANLLTVTSFGLPPVQNTLNGPIGGNSATFSGSDTALNTVTFTSSYLDFLGPMPPGTASTDKAFGFSFSSVFMNYSVSGVPPFASITPFTAAGTGTFSATTGVPEPGAVAMLAGLGVTGSLFAFRRLRRRR